MTTHFRELRAHLVPVRFMELKRFLMLSFRHVAQHIFENIYIYFLGRKCLFNPLGHTFPEH